MHLRHARHRRHHRNGRLAAAGDHVDVELLEVLLQVDHRHAIGAYRGRGQVDHAKSGLVAPQERVVLHMRRGTGSVEDEVDLVKDRQAGQALHAFMGSGHAQSCCAGQTVGRRVDTDHGGHFQMLRVAHHLDHQVGADIAGADDGDFAFLTHGKLLTGPQQRQRLRGPGLEYLR
ncbi:hypothetical protein D3C81_1182730 [compost metagenome]